MIPPELLRQCYDPIKFAKLFWPKVEFYDKQIEVIYSVMNNDETFVPAGNQLGKDFVTGFIALWFFLTRTPCRIITTSVDHAQLEGVLWGEIRRFIQTSRIPLDVSAGGMLICNHLLLRKVVNGEVCPISYLRGRTAAKGEGMLGHHVADVGDGVPRTLAIFDESSGIEDEAYRPTLTWSKRRLIIGNPYPTNNFFRKGVEAGDLEALG